MKIAIVTGCNGFIGNRLCNFLLSKHYKVYGVDVSKSYLKNDNFFFTNIAEIDNLKIILKNENALLFHLAWSGVSTIDKNNKSKQEDNIDLTSKILNFANEIKTKKIIVPGTMSEFAGSTKPVTGLEESSPSDLYAETKVKVRELVSSYCKKSNLDFNWLLITSVYGGNRNDANLLTTCIDSLVHNKDFSCTSLEQQWDFIHIDDLIKALYLVSIKGKSGAIYPVGSGEVHPLSFYVELIASKFDKKNLLKIGALPYKKDFIDNSIPDITNLKKLGFSPSLKFEQGIDSIIIDRKKHLKGKRVSVLMTSYNGSAYIKDQVCSILKNLGENDELIVSDDGSKDSTKDILIKLADSDKRLVLIDGPRRGQNKNVEYLYSKASGEYIFISDQDDIWHENKVETVLRYFYANPDAIVVHHNSNLIDKDGKIFGKPLYETISFSNKLSHFIVKSHIFGSMSAFRRELLQYDLVPSKNVYDAGIACFAMRLKKLMFVDDILMDYRRHDSNASSWNRSLGTIIKERIHLLFFILRKVLFLRKKKNR